MLKILDYSLLKDLCLTHSVTGDTIQIQKKITFELTRIGLKNFSNKYGTIFVGNENNPEKIFAAHIDEVGFQITKIEKDGKIRILPIGWVFPNRFDHAYVYVSTKNGLLDGVIFHEDDLKTENIDSFDSLFLWVGCKNDSECKNAGVYEGAFGSFIKRYIERNDLIISSSIDNKVSVFVLLELLKNNKDFAKKHLFIFTTDEEMADHSANGVCHTIHGQMAIVLDYCPIHQKLKKTESLGLSGLGPIVMYRGGSQVLHEEIREYFYEKITSKYQKGFLSEQTLSSLETYNFQNNGSTKAVNVCIPAFGYHGSSYCVNKTDIEDFYYLVKEIAEKEI